MRNWICMFLLSGSLLVQGQDLTGQIYRAYVSGRMELWKEAMEKMEREYRSVQNDALLYQLAEAEYGYIAHCIAEGKKEEAKRWLEKAEKHVESLLKTGRDLPRVYGLQGALYGFRVGLEPLKAPFFGRKSAEANQKAIELGPDEPQAWLEKANIEFYKPAVFGGSKKRAVPLYEKAVRLFEADPKRTRQNWIYLNTLAALASAYEETGEVEKADRVYGKMLVREPALVWLRDEVYPAFRKRHSLR